MLSSKSWRLILLVLGIVLLPTVYGRLLRKSRMLNLYAASATATGSPEITVARDAPPPPDTVRVLTFNIAHGRGLATSNFDGGDPETRLRRLDAIAETLKTLDADIVVLNEVDFATSWSQGVNQARYLADKAGYAHRLEQRNMDGRALLWTWRSGNAVLSKFPLGKPVIIDLPGFALWESQLIGKKRGLRCDVELPGRTVRLFAMHLSHRSETLRVESAQRLLAETQQSPYPSILAGDTNSTLPHFPEAQFTPSGENAMQTCLDLGLTMQPLDAPTESQLTFPAAQPACVIDWILVDKTLSLTQYQVVPTELSDHCLVWADVAFGE